MKTLFSSYGKSRFELQSSFKTFITNRYNGKLKVHVYHFSLVCSPEKRLTTKTDNSSVVKRVEWSWSRGLLARPTNPAVDFGYRLQIWEIFRGRRAMIIKNGFQRFFMSGLEWALNKTNYFRQIILFNLAL